MKKINSLTWNTLANYVALAYTTFIGIIILPFYLTYLGAEAFGLLSFFTLLQSWMRLLDLGMSPLLSRQMAFARGEKNGFPELKKLLRSLELIGVGLAVTISLGIALGRNWIAGAWLNVESLPLSSVALCIVLMGIVIGLRFTASLYRSGIRGMEDHFRLNIVNVILATVTYIGGFLLVRFVTQDIEVFFKYQLCVAVMELIVLGGMIYRVMPSTDSVGLHFYWKIMRRNASFAAGIAYTSGIWILITQLDKLILSSVLSLSEYGYFALVAIVVAGMSAISGPLRIAILPRMTYLLAQGKEEEMLVLYRRASQLLAVIIFPTVGMVALFPVELLFAWTGDIQAAKWAGPILTWFALGNGILSIGAFQYYLQYAHGKLRMHVIYITVSAIIQVPLIVYSAYEYGAIGVAITWFFIRLITFMIWTPIVHARFAAGIHWSWLSNDLGPVFLSSSLLLLLYLNLEFDYFEMGRRSVAITLAGAGLSILAVNLLVSKAGRKLINQTVRWGNRR